MIIFRKTLLVGCWVILSLLTHAQGKDEADSLTFWNAIRPISDSVGKAYSFWEIAVRGKWEGMNTDSLYNEFLGLRNQFIVKNADFIRNNPDNSTALDHFKAYILNRRFIPLDSIQLMFSNFSESLKKSPNGLFIDSALERKAKVAINASAPDFSFRSSDSKSYNISSFRGRPVLICFWASWCGPCVRNIPMLKTIQEQYGEKLQMISVSIDNSESKWREALSKYRMNWIQTCDIAPYTSGTPIRNIYEVHFIPEYIILDGEGRVVYQNFLLKDDTYEILKDKLNGLK